MIDKIESSQEYIQQSQWTCAQDILFCFDELQQCICTFHELKPSIHSINIKPHTISLYKLPELELTFWDRVKILYQQHLRLLSGDEVALPFKSLTSSQLFNFLAVIGTHDVHGILELLTTTTCINTFKSLTTTLKQVINTSSHCQQPVSSVYDVDFCFNLSSPLNCTVRSSISSPHLHLKSTTMAH